MFTHPESWGQFETRHFSQKPQGLASKLSGCWLLLGLASRGLYLAALGDSEFYSTHSQPEVTGAPWGQGRPVGDRM